MSIEKWRAIRGWEGLYEVSEMTMNIWTRFTKWLETYDESDMVRLKTKLAEPREWGELVELTKREMAALLDLHRQRYGR